MPFVVSLPFLLNLSSDLNVGVLGKRAVILSENVRVVVVSWRYYLLRLFVSWVWSSWRNTKTLCPASIECPSSSQSVPLPSARSIFHLGWFRCRRWTTSHLSGGEHRIYVKTCSNHLVVTQQLCPLNSIYCVPVQLRAQSELQKLLFLSLVENFVPVMLVITSGKSPATWLTWMM